MVSVSYPTVSVIVGVRLGAGSGLGFLNVSRRLGVLHEIFLQVLLLSGTPLMECSTVQTMLALNEKAFLNLLIVDGVVP